MNLKIPSAEWQPFCHSLNVLRDHLQQTSTMTRQYVTHMYLYWNNILSLESDNKIFFVNLFLRSWDQTNRSHKMIDSYIFSCTTWILEKSLNLKTPGPWESYPVSRFEHCRQIFFYGNSIFITLGQFWPSSIVVYCVCLSVCVSVRASITSLSAR